MYGLLKSMKAIAAGVTLAVAAGAFASSVAAQSLNGPLTIVIPYGAGGGNDTVARALATPLGKALGVPVVVENRTGAGGSIGVAYFIDNSKPDGQMVLMTSTSALTNLPRLDANVPYKFDDVKPLLRLTQLVETFVTSNAVPHGSPKEFMDFYKANPDKVTLLYSAKGDQAWMAVQQFSKVLGFEAVAVPINSGGGADQATMVAGNHVQGASMSLTSAKSGVENKQLNLVAVLQEEREPTYPDVPTMKESGYDIVVGDEVSLYVNKETPDNVAKIIDTAVQIALQDPDFIKVMAGRGLRPQYLDGKGLTDIVAMRNQKAMEFIGEAK